MKTKLDELAATIAMRREAGFDAARALVVTKLGKTTMDRIRRDIEAFESQQRAVVTAEAAASEVSGRAAIRYSAAAGVVGVVLVAIGLWSLERAWNAQDARERDERAMLHATARSGSRRAPSRLSTSTAARWACAA